MFSIVAISTRSKFIRQSAIYMLVLYALALVMYLIARVVRARQGIDLTKTHAEIPVE